MAHPSSAWWDVQDFFNDTQVSSVDWLLPFRVQNVYLFNVQKLPCKFKFDVPNTGHLEGSSEKHVRTVGVWLSVESSLMT